MQEEGEPTLQVIVDDELLDLRNVTFNIDDWHRSPFYTKVSDSEPSLKDVSEGLARYRGMAANSAIRGDFVYKTNHLDTKIQKEIRNKTTAVDGFKKIPNSLYKSGTVAFSSVSTTTATIATTSKGAKLKNKTLGNKVLYNADPRFRRSPPKPHHTFITASDSRVSGSERRKKSQSESKFLINSHVINEGVPTPRMPIGDSATIFLNHSPIRRNHNETSKWNDHESNPENPLPTGTSTATGNSGYQSAICVETDVRESCNLTQRNQIGRPCWDDPRLLGKYGMLLKPVSLAPRNSLSSWTLPAVEEPSLHRVPLGNITPKCSKIHKRTSKKCTCTFRDTGVYTEAFHVRKPEVNLFNSAFSTAFFSFGSVCGLVLLACIVWIVLANDLLRFPIQYFQKDVPPRPTGVPVYLEKILGGIIYGITYLFKAVRYLFVAPRN